MQRRASVDPHLIELIMKKINFNIGRVIKHAPIERPLTGPLVFLFHRLLIDFSISIIINLNF